MYICGKLQISRIISSSHLKKKKKNYTRHSYLIPKFPQEEPDEGGFRAEELGQFLHSRRIRERRQFRILDQGLRLRPHHRHARLRSESRNLALYALHFLRKPGSSRESWKF